MRKVVVTGFLLGLARCVFGDLDVEESLTQGEWVVPPSTESSTGVCVVPGTEYASRWGLVSGDKAIAFKGVEAEACAQHCLETESCRGATFWADRPPEKSNCWLKTWEGETAAKPCIPGPVDTGELNALVVVENVDDCAQLAWKNMEQFECSLEPEDPATAAAIEDGPLVTAPAPSR